MEKQPNIFYRILEFIGNSNFFISLCATSLTAWAQHRVYGRIFSYDLLLTFSATFLLYNGQRLFLALVPAGHQHTGWYARNKKILFLLMALALGGLFPLYFITAKAWIVYATSLVLGLLYFLPFSNLRSIPMVKSLLVGFVWVLVCVIAPTKQIDIFFCLAQLFFVTALCVLFNIRDMEHDAESGTYTIPVIYGEAAAKKVTLVLLFLYLIASGLNLVSIITFLPTAYFTLCSNTKNHAFFYTFGVDGLILLQSLLGILFLLP